MTRTRRDPLAEVLLGLKHPHESVRQRAAIGLGALVTPDLAGRVAATLWEEPDFFVRESLTWVLTRVPRAALPYALVALGDERARVRLTAAHVLGKLGDRSAVPALVPLTADSDDDVAAKACFALARLGDPVAVPALAAYLGRGDRDRRDRLTRDLADFGPAALPHVEGRLVSSEPAVREHAAEVVALVLAEQRRKDLTLTRRQPPPSRV
jgi:HEAT repeat protein